MENKQAHQFLLSLDLEYERGVECPPDFDFEKEVLNVRLVETILEKRLDVPLVTGINSAQDSYFFAEIIHRENENSDHELLDIRFSCFGRMVSAWARPELTLKLPGLFETIEKAVESEGYKFIDSEWLVTAEYDGCDPRADAERMTWWRRFFDYT